VIAAALVAVAGGTWPVSVYLIVLAVVSLVSVLLTQETSSNDLTVATVE
jgi:hypothetical protein